MIRYFCDRCENPIPGSPIDRGAVSGAVGCGTDYQLCQNCNRTLITVLRAFMKHATISITNWPGGTE